MRTDSRVFAVLFAGAIVGPALFTAAPDYFAAFDPGNVTPAAAPADGGTKRTVFAYYGRANTDGGDGSDVQLNFRAERLSGDNATEVCSRRIITRLPDRTGSKVLAFTLFYQRGNRVIPAAGKPTQYRLFASTTQPNTPFAPYEEPPGNAANNEATVIITAPEGGTVSCSQVVNIRPLPAALSPR